MPGAHETWTFYTQWHAGITTSLQNSFINLHAACVIQYLFILLSIVTAQVTSIRTLPVSQNPNVVVEVSK